jgi:hypothetical protein
MDTERLLRECRKPISPETEIKGANGTKLVDFWRWAYSDMIFGNTNRGYFGQFLVGTALGVTEKECMLEWDSWDLNYGEWKIEVKTKGMVRTTQKPVKWKPSFSIEPTLLVDRDVNGYDGERKRWSDCYVFVYFEEDEPTPAKLLDTSNYEFYVRKTSTLPNAKSIGLSAVRKSCRKVGYESLRSEIDRILAAP